VTWREYASKVLIDQETLQTRVAELGARISEDYRGKELLLVCVLKGGVMFLTDLMRRVTVPQRIDFMAISSYGTGVRESSGIVRILMDLSADIKNKHVLIVEDIIDTGHTLEYILRLLRARSPASLRVCCLLDKFERRQADIEVDYVGFSIPDEFVFGYGLDIDELYREVPLIAVLDPKYYGQVIGD